MNRPHSTAPRGEAAAADWPAAATPALNDPARRFEKVLRAGYFAITAELAPPDCADPGEVLKRAAVFDGVVDAINATDGSGANVHMSSIAVSAILHRGGYTAVAQMSCRDRNRIAMQGDALGAAALGVGNILCLSGDGVACGDHPGAKPVFDLGSVSLLSALRGMRDEGKYLSGRKIDPRPRYFLGAAVNPFAPPVKRRADLLEAKVTAGAQFFQTQYCFDMLRLKAFMERYIDLGFAEKVPLLVGVGPLASVKTARWIRSNVPGVHIPDTIIARLEQAAKPAEEGRRLCVELIQQIREVDGVAGVHLMAHRQEAYVAEMLEASGLLAERRSVGTDG